MSTEKVTFRKLDRILAKFITAMNGAALAEGFTLDTKTSAGRTTLEVSQNDATGSPRVLMRVEAEVARSMPQSAAPQGPKQLGLFEQATSNSAPAVAAPAAVDEEPAARVGHPLRARDTIELDGVRVEVLAVDDDGFAWWDPTDHDACTEERAAWADVEMIAVDVWVTKKPAPEAVEVPMRALPARALPEALPSYLREVAEHARPGHWSCVTFNRREEFETRECATLDELRRTHAALVDGDQFANRFLLIVGFAADGWPVDGLEFTQYEPPPRALDQHPDAQVFRVSIPLDETVTDGQAWATKHRLTRMPESSERLTRAERALRACHVYWHVERAFGGARLVTLVPRDLVGPLARYAEGIEGLTFTPADVPFDHVLRAGVAVRTERGPHRVLFVAERVSLYHAQTDDDPEQFPVLRAELDAFTPDHDAACWTVRDATPDVPKRHAVKRSEVNASAPATKSTKKVAKKAAKKGRAAS